jgi:tungstate transport system ATP-binding protein
LGETETVSANLRVEGLTKNYRNVKALDSVTFNAKGGKIAVLVGVNGAGKTTLLRIIAGLDKQEEGSILFNNREVADKELRQVATLVFQRTAMFSRSVYDNLAFGLRLRAKKDSEINEKITEALHDVGLKNFEKRKAKKTSGGEQQRISLARAFLLEPKILLLDEPTANLDPNSAMIIEKAILNRKKDDTIIMIATHNLSQASRLGDEIIHIHDGRIIETENSEEFFRNPKSDLTRKFINGELEF